MMQGRWKVGAAWPLVCVLALSAGAAERAPQIKRLSDREVEQRETQARPGRLAFETNNYTQAVSVFEPLAAEFTTSQPLYLNELATVHLMRNDFGSAKRYLVEAATMMQTYDPKSEKRALSLFGAEEQKLFKGDAAERVANGLLLALCFLNEGDVDNALACIKTAELNDSDVAGEGFKSDWALLYGLEAMCYRLRGDAEQQQQCSRQFVDAYVATHPRMRGLTAAQQVLRDALAKNKDDEEKGILSRGMEELDAQAAQIRRSIRVKRHFKRLATCDYNVLVLVPSGRGLEKQRRGQYGEQMVIVDPCKDVNQRFVATVGGSDLYYDTYPYVCDLAYQGSTQGGRLMDNVLQRQASFKRTTSAIGDALLDDDTLKNAMNAHPLAGLAVLVIGGAMKGISAATTAKADIRCWQTLPGEFQVLPLQLEPGEHTIQVRGYHRYVPDGEAEAVRVQVPSGAALRIVFADPV